MTDQTPPMTPGRALAQWWAEQLGSPRFDNGDAMSSMLYTLAVDTSGGPTEEQTTKFVERLTDFIDGELKHRPQYGVMLGVDYGPDHELAEAAEVAGIPIGRFPWKTRTHATADYVTVALGYGSPHSLLWSLGSWERPACGQSHYADKEKR